MFILCVCVCCPFPILPTRPIHLAMGRVEGCPPTLSMMASNSVGFPYYHIRIYIFFSIYMETQYVTRYRTLKSRQ